MNTYGQCALVGEGQCHEVKYSNKLVALVREEKVRGREAGIIEGREAGLTEGETRGREAGKTEGREAGITEGEKRAKLEIAKNLKAAGLPIEQSPPYAGFSSSSF